MRGLIFTLAFVAVLALPSRVTATPITLTFEGEGLIDSDPVTNEFASSGVTFSNAIALTSGIVNPFDMQNPCGEAPGSLGDAGVTPDFPARSGCDVISDFGGALRIDFATSVSAFSAYFTYLTQLTVEAFNSTGPLGSVSSMFTENIGSGVNSPNELLALSIPDIRWVVVTGDPLGGSFTLDDLTFTPLADTEPPNGTPVPEPGTIVLVGLAGARLLMNRRRT